MRLAPHSALAPVTPIIVTAARVSWGVAPRRKAGEANCLPGLWFVLLLTIEEVLRVALRRRVRQGRRRQGRAEAEPPDRRRTSPSDRSEEHTSELQSLRHLV